MSQIPLLCLSARFSIWIFDLMERYIKNWYSQTGPRGVYICVGSGHSSFSRDLAGGSFVQELFWGVPGAFPEHGASESSRPAPACPAGLSAVWLRGVPAVTLPTPLGCAGASLLRTALGIPTAIPCCGTVRVSSKVHCDRGLFLYIDFLNVFQ